MRVLLRLLKKRVKGLLTLLSHLNISQLRFILLDVTSIIYPVSKQEYGNAMWKIMHSYTANLPDKLTTDDRRKFKHTLLDLVDKFPCPSCKDHALEYIKSHRPKENSKSGYFNYLCEFHNQRNIEDGKPTQDCQTIAIKEHSCPTCSATNGPNKQVQIHSPEATKSQTNQKNISKIDQVIDYSLKSQMGDIKDTSRKIFEKMCANANVKMPELIFTDKTPCSDPDNSCTHLTLHPNTNKLVDGTKVYLNVNQYSPRTAVHEALHYIRKAKGLDALNETSIEKEARTIIANDFPLDVFKTNKAFSVKQEVNDEKPLTKYDPIGNYKERAARRLQTVEDTFPYFSRYYHPAKVHKKEEPAPQVVPTMTYSDGRPVYPTVPTQPTPPEKQEPPSASEGFTSMLDPIYAPFANWLGLKPRDVNDAHTPALLANAGIVLAESNLSKFGSMAISLLGSVATLLVGTLAKEQIGFADKKLLVGLGGVSYGTALLDILLILRSMKKLQAQAMEFGLFNMDMDFEAMVGTMTTDQPKMESDPEKMLLRGGKQGVGGTPLRQNLSAPVGGQPKKVGKGKQDYEIDQSDIYMDPDSTISSQGSFSRRDPFFPVNVYGMIIEIQ